MSPRPSLFARIAATAAAASMASSPVLAQANAVGVNAAIRNKVEIRHVVDGKIRPAVLRERVLLNDVVRTEAASQLQILLLDRTIFTVGAKARITVDRFVYDPAAGSRSMGISVTRGAFRFMSGRTLGRASGPVSVRTPVATIGIRGTIFEGVVGEDAADIARREPAVGKKVKSKEDEASLIVLRGPGRSAQGDVIPGAIDVTAGGQIAVLDAPGLAVYVPRRGAAPIGPFQISAPGLLALQSLLRTTPTAGGGGKGSHGARDAAIGVAAVAAAVAGASILGGKNKKKKARPNRPVNQAPPGNVAKPPPRN
jgi:hypothetical protein